MNNTKYLLDTLNIFKYNSGNGVEVLKDSISKMYSNENVFITLNGRSAIYLFLKSLNLPKGSKVAVQAFTCNAVINPILNSGLAPFYIDIEKDGFNMSYDSLLKAYYREIKVLVWQHTFGIAGDSRIAGFCKEKGIYLIEDCAHTLGNTEIGKLGDATMLSFGMEKMISSRVGGALIVNNEEINAKVKSVYSQKNYVSVLNSFKWMINPILWRLVRAVKGNGSLLKRLGILKSGFESGENLGNGNYSSLQSLSPVLANTVLECLVSLESLISHRTEISKIYSTNLVQKYDAIIRYPYIAKNIDSANTLINYLESRGYPSQDRWYFPVIFPKSTNLESMKYTLGSCPVAEEISSIIVNLPTGTGIDSNVALEIVKYINDNSL